MTKGTLNAAVVGCGFIGRMHIRMYAEHPTATLEGVIDIDEDAARDAASDFDANWWATDTESALADNDIDVVSIATPEAYHREPTITALDHGCTVLLEKPIAETVDDALAIGNAADQSSGALMIGYLLRFHPEYAAIKERLENGDLGDVVSMHADRIRDRDMYVRAANWTNTVYYLSVHDIDIMRWYTGAEVTEVHARGGQPLEGLEEPSVVSGSLEFADGSIGTFESNWARSLNHPAYRSDQFRVTGTDGFAEKRERANVQVTTDKEFDYEQPAELHDRAIGALRNQVAHIVDCARTGDRPMVTWRDGVASLVVANALRKSLGAGQPVSVNYPDI